MQKQTLLALAVLGVLLVGLFIFTQTDSNAPNTTTVTIPAIAQADRITIDHNATSIELTRDGAAWSLTKPIQYPLEPSAQSALASLNAPIAMDLSLRDAKPEQYEIKPDSPKVTVFKDGKATASLTLGKEVRVSQTNVERTFLSLAESAGVFRAQAGLRSALVRTVDDWRKRSITDFDAQEIASITIQAPSQNSPLTFKRTTATDPWTFGNDATVQLDQEALERLVRTASTLRAQGFADTTPPDTTGLQNPLTLTFQPKDTSKPPTVVHLGNVVESDTGAQSASRYVRIEGAKWIYTIPSFTAQSLYVDLSHLRAKEMGSIQRETIASIHIQPSGKEDQPISMQQDNGAWSLEGSVSKPIPAANLERFLSALDPIRALRVPASAPDAVGLGKDAKTHTVTIELQDGTKRVLRLGQNAQGETAETPQYAQLDDGLVFMLSALDIETFQPTQDDLTREPPPPVQGGGLQGLPPGLLQGLQ